MNYVTVFERVEQKYLISGEQRECILKNLSEKLFPDEYGKSTVTSLYFDTPDFRIIRSSIDSDNYKEKLRIRFYGSPSHDHPAFFEIKRKLNGRVYKRREVMSVSEAEKYVCSGFPPRRTQKTDEVDAFLRFYDNPIPRLMISCEREAFFFRDDERLRLTFDNSVRYGFDDVGPYGHIGDEKILDDGTYIMEFKTMGYMPLYFARLLSGLRVYPVSFSKCGSAYAHSKMKM